MTARHPATHDSPLPAQPHTGRQVAGSVAALFAGPVALWLAAETAVLHGRGPTVWEFTG
ncbi:hypothetical protein ACWDSF_23885 [Nocardia beijingensis]|uniref:hypothetical protein n=1 Tax=Nocardia beijingensis TaxID=95162 RepID=UPI0033B23DDA